MMNYGLVWILLLFGCNDILMILLKESIVTINN